MRRAQRKRPPDVVPELHHAVFRDCAVTPQDLLHTLSTAAHGEGRREEMARVQDRCAELQTGIRAQQTTPLCNPPPSCSGQKFPLYGPLCGADHFW